MYGNRLDSNLPTYRPKLPLWIPRFFILKPKVVTIVAAGIYECESHNVHHVRS